jgi:hypothetical protein
MSHLLALSPAEETAGTPLVVEEDAGKEGQLRLLVPASGGRVSPHGSRPGGRGTRGG